MTKRIAHRGASGYFPENTLSALKKAVELKSDIVEIDVRACQDGELVLMHDPDVKRTTDGRGKVINLSIDKLKQLSIKNSEKIPTLREAIDILKNKTIINFEIKHSGFERQLLDLLEENDIKHNSIISSFSLMLLKNIKEFDGNSQKNFITRYPFKVNFDLLKKYEITDIQPHCLLTTRRFVNKAHNQGFKLNTWTVNSPAWIYKFKKMGIDGIISNFPDRI